MKIIASPAFWDNLPLKFKNIALLTVPLSAIFFTVASIYTVANDRGSAERWVQHSLAVQACVQQTRILLLEAESSVRGFLVTGSPRILEPYEHARREVKSLRPQMLALTGDDSAQSQRANDAHRLIDHEFSTLDQLQRAGSARIANGQPGESDTALLAKDASLMGQLRERLAAIQEQEDQTLSARLLGQRQLYTKLFNFAILISLFVPFCSLLINISLTSRLVRRIRNVQTAARMLVHESPLTPIPSGKDEIGQLGQTIRQSALRLDLQVKELRRVEDQFIKLFDQLPVVCCATDGRGVIRFVNRFGAEALGYEPDQMIGKPAGEFVRSASGRPNRHRLEPRLSAPAPQSASTEVWTRRDGSQVRMKVRENMVPNDAGHPEGIQWVLVCEPVPETRSPIAFLRRDESVARGQQIG